jgi:hypothetical protein
MYQSLCSICDDDSAQMRKVLKNYLKNFVCMKD